jgi:hypothetical protein
MCPVSSARSDCLWSALVDDQGTDVQTVRTDPTGKRSPTTASSGDGQAHGTQACWRVPAARQHDGVHRLRQVWGMPARCALAPNLPQEDLRTLWGIGS